MKTLKKTIFTSILIYQLLKGTYKENIWNKLRWQSAVASTSSMQWLNCQRFSTKSDWHGSISDKDLKILSQGKKHIMFPLLRYYRHNSKFQWLKKLICTFNFTLHEGPSNKPWTYILRDWHHKKIEIILMVYISRSQNSMLLFFLSKLDTRMWIMAMSNKIISFNFCEWKLNSPINDWHNLQPKGCMTRGHKN